MSQIKLVLFEAFAAAFNAYLDTLKYRYCPIVNAEHGVLGYMDGSINFISFNSMWNPDGETKFNNLAINCNMLEYTCGGLKRSLMIRTLDFTKSCQFTSAYDSDYYPNHNSDKYRGYIIGNTIQFTSVDEHLLIGRKSQTIFIKGRPFSHCKYYYNFDIKLTRVMPITTIYRNLEFAYIQDIDQIVTESGFTIFGQRGYLNHEYYQTSDRHWQLCDLAGNRYVCIQLQSLVWALYTGNSAPTLLLQPAIVN